MTVPSSFHSTSIGVLVLALEGPATVKVKACSGWFTVTLLAGVEEVMGLTREYISSTSASSFTA